MILFQSLSDPVFFFFFGVLVLVLFDGVFGCDFVLLVDFLLFGW